VRVASHLRQRKAPVHKEKSKRFQAGSAKFSGDDTTQSLCDLNVERVHELLLHSA
jgi:hypothetical protein